MDTDGTTPQQMRGGGGRLLSDLFSREMGLLLLRNNFLLIFAAVFIIAAILSDNFLTVRNLANLLQQSAIVGIVAVGMTYVILTANIDLSVGSMTALTGMLVAVFMVSGIDPVLSVLLTLLIGSGIGALMGFISGYGSVPSFIVTLAGLVTLRGITYLLTEGVPVSGLPEGFAAFGSLRFGPVSVLGVLFLATALIGGLVLKLTVFGEYVYATGGNMAAARLSGVPTRRTVVAVFALSGLCAAISGILQTSRLRIGQPTAAEGLELDAIAAVVLGGTSLFGGRGSIVGTVVAVILLQMLRNIFNLLGLGSFYQMTITGVIIILAILLNRWIDRRMGET